MSSANYEILIIDKLCQGYIVAVNFLSNQSNVIEGKKNLRYKIIMCFNPFAVIKLRLRTGLKRSIFVECGGLADERQ